MLGLVESGRLNHMRQPLVILVNQMYKNNQCLSTSFYVHIFQVELFTIVLGNFITQGMIVAMKYQYAE
jgi:hypothetical protein